jgi:23S rRNA (cytosine1962-C5)-methyltransferase
MVSLLDVGNGERIEQLGDKLVIRPSSLALWPLKAGLTENLKPFANYIPESGWVPRERENMTWQVPLGAFSCVARLLENGQVGLFPEHLGYFSKISNVLESAHDQLQQPPRVLNLFAYTGLASLWSMKHGAEVTHVELSKKILGWAKENFQCSDEGADSCRLIPEDAFVFAEREQRRGSQYQVIISDPPSFGRTAKGKSWSLEEKIVSHIQTLLTLLAPQGSLFFTTHHHALTGPIVANIVASQGDVLYFTTEYSPLELIAVRSGKILPCGWLTHVRRGK